MRNIFVDPADGRGGFVVVADVAHQLTREIPHRSEDTSRNNLALNLGKPNFYLIEPAGVGRGVVDTDRGVGFKEFRNSLGFVRTQIIDNNVDFATRGLTGYDLRKEIGKLGTGVASTGLS
jgi:hypothetical protein